MLEGETPGGRPVVVSHSPEPALRTVAVLDAVLNNSDRKGSHLLRDGDIVRGCDHGVSLGVQPKLRTVLWGWAGEEIPDGGPRPSRRPPRRPRPPAPGALAAELGTLITRAEVEALRARTRALLRTRRHPVPQPGLARHPVAGAVGAAP